MLRCVFLQSDADANRRHLLINGCVSVNQIHILKKYLNNSQMLAKIQGYNFRVLAKIQMYFYEKTNYQ